MNRIPDPLNAWLRLFGRPVIPWLLIASLTVPHSSRAGAEEGLSQRAVAQADLANPGQPLPAFVPGELLVGFRPGAAGRADQVRNQIGARTLNEWPGLRAQHWGLPRGLDVARAIEMLSRNPNVEYAEPNYIYELDQFPSDPPNDLYRGELWGLHNVGQTGGTLGADIGAMAAWAVQTGSDSVVVAVIDTGIDYTHEDLAANLWLNPGETGLDENGNDKATNGIDDDGNGFIDDWRGWNFLDKNNDATDLNGHGTHVAGTIGALGDNGLGVIGVSPVVRILPLKIGNFFIETADAVAAIVYAASFKDTSGNTLVRISNNSWGGGRKSKTLENAIKNSGALFCASAGNSASSSLHYPAAYNLANVVAVAATEHNDDLAWFSNFGSWVHLAAPGVNVFSSSREGGYRFASGTSMATPHVVGALALLRAEVPAWDNATLKSHLLATVDLKASLAGMVASGGRLNVANALGAPNLPEDSTAPDPVFDLFVSAATEDSVTLNWSDANDPPGYLYDVRFHTHLNILDPALAPTSWSENDWDSATTLFGEPLPWPGSTSLTIEGLSLSTVYSFAVRVVDAAGNISSLLTAVVPAKTTSGDLPEPSLLLIDDMEADVGFWLAEGNDRDKTAANKPPRPGNNNLWHRTTRRGTDPGHSPVWSWRYSIPEGENYDTGMRNWGRLYSQPFTLSPGSKATLFVSQFVEVENHWDFERGIVQIRVNGGDWQNVFQRWGTGGSFYTDAIDLTPHLSATEDRLVQIGFFFDTRDARFNQFEGWYVDDVILKHWQ
jgi:subtilisin family serine protease